MIKLITTLKVTKFYMDQYTHHEALSVILCMEVEISSVDIVGLHCVRKKISNPLYK